MVIGIHWHWIENTKTVSSNCFFFGWRLPNNLAVWNILNVLFSDQLNIQSYIKIGRAVSEADENCDTKMLYIRFNVNIINLKVVYYPIMHGTTHKDVIWHLVDDKLE